MEREAKCSGLFSVEALSKDCPSGYVKICEGSTAVLFPPAMVRGSQAAPAEGTADHFASVQYSAEPSGGEAENQAVFYNPAQVVNRDLSVCALELFSRLRRSEPRRRGGTTEGITILEALSASGLRAIRYFKEVSGVRYVIANDMDSDAVDCIRRNCEYNGVPLAKPTIEANFPSAMQDLPNSEHTMEGEHGGAVIVNQDDANDLMHRLAVNPGVHAGKRLCAVHVDTAVGATTSPVILPLLQEELMDVVDLDPYGSASPFLEAAMSCIKEGGLMLVTSTDSAILCGAYVDTCHAKYSSVPYKGSHCHEMAVRILLAHAERVANKHKKFIVPLLSLHIDFYVRCFFRVYTQPAEVKLSPCKLGYLLQCTHCPGFWLRPLTFSRPPRGTNQKRPRQDAMVQAEKGSTDDAHISENCLPRSHTFPVVPSRQGNPKLHCISLQRLVIHDESNCACPVCGSSVALAGPLYAAPTQNLEFLKQLLEVVEERAREGKLTAVGRITGLIHVAMEELPDCPLFYTLPDIASYVKVRCPPTPNVVGALARLGFECSQVHCAPAGLKTNCPPDTLVRVMLQWKALQGTALSEEVVVQLNAQPDTLNGTERVSKRRPAAAEPVRLLVAPLENADFTYDRQYDFRRQATGVAKFIPNAPGWGPKRRHNGAMRLEEE